MMNKSLIWMLILKLILNIVRCNEMEPIRFAGYEWDVSFVNF